MLADGQGLNGVGKRSQKFLEKLLIS